MSKNPEKISIIVKCKSKEHFCNVINFSRTLIQPNSEFIWKVYNIPDYLGRGDRLKVCIIKYFEFIETLIEQDNENLSYFIMIFHIKKDVDSLWKNIIISIISKIESNCPDTKCRIIR